MTSKKRAPLKNSPAPLGTSVEPRWWGPVDVCQQTYPKSYMELYEINNGSWRLLFIYISPMMNDFSETWWWEAHVEFSGEIPCNSYKDSPNPNLHQPINDGLTGFVAPWPP